MVIRIDLAESETNVYNSTGDVGLPRGRRNNKMAGQIKVSASLQEDRGIWCVRGRVCDLYTGKVTHRSKSTGLSVKGNHKREAQAAMQEIVEEWEADANKDLQNNSPLFSVFVEKWLERKRSLKIKENTIKSYQDYVKSHIGPRFGNIPISQITVKDIEDFFFEYLKTHTVSSARKVNCVLSGAFKEGIRAGYVQANLADSSHLEFPKAEKFEGTFYTEEEVAALLEAAKEEGEPIRAAIILAVLYGLRRSEVLGLRWRDVNFVKGTLTVCNTVTANGELWIEESKTKTAKSRRTLNLIPATIPYLESLKKAQRLAGIVPMKVCAWLNGDRVRPDYIYRKTQKLMKQAGLPVIRFHDLRHTAASLLAPSVSPQQLQRFLGHEDISTTYGTYAHLMDRERVATAETMSYIMAGSGISV